MNLQELKEIINKYKDRFNLIGEKPGNNKQNNLLFKEISNKHPKIFKSCSEIIYLIKSYNNLENLHIFCRCGNKNKFKDSTLGYFQHCSIRCSNNDEKVKEKEKQTKLNNIDENDNNSYQREKLTKLNNISENGLNSYQISVIKQHKTKLKKYGDETYNNRKKCNQTKLNNIDEDGNNSYQRAVIKAKQTKLNNIVDGKNSYQRQTIKCKQTRLNNIDESGNNSYQKAKIKEKQTKLNDIDENGNNSYQRIAIKRLNDIDENGLNSYQRARIKGDETILNNTNEDGLNGYQIANIKRYETMKRRYDAKSYFETQEFKNNLDEFQQKRYRTKKKNHTFNISEAEEEIYKSLLTKFSTNDIFRQYKSKLYPFICDFYIKSLDLYIEYHGNWNHCPTKHRHPFKNSIEDLEVVEYLKKKSEEINFKGKKKKYYLNVIYVWTNLDVRKLQMFKKNKLNHCVFYNLDQFYNWFSKI